MQGICTHGQVQCLCLSTWNVTKHRDQSSSLTGINWVSDGVGIDFIEYMHYKSVHFYSSLEQTVIVDSWERHRVIPMRTKLLLLSNRLQGLPVEQKNSELVFSIHMVVSTYTSESVTRGIQNILMDQKIVPACCEG